MGVWYRKAAFAAGLCFFALTLVPALAGAKVNKSFLGTVVEGYDVVAYFTEGKPVEGSREFTHEWKGATWRFASAEHRDLFAANPEKYAPQYGGFCAYAVAKGSTAGIDPEAWTIHDGKLYLNLNKDIQGIWSEDIPGYVAKADANWPGISGESVAANPCNPCAAKSANPCNRGAAKSANPCATKRGHNPCGY